MTRGTRGVRLNAKLRLIMVITNIISFFSGGNPARIPAAEVGIAGYVRLLLNTHTLGVIFRSLCGAGDRRHKRFKVPSQQRSGLSPPQANARQRRVTLRQKAPWNIVAPFPTGLHSWCYEPWAILR